MTKNEKSDLGFDIDIELGYVSPLYRPASKITGHDGGKYLKLTQYDYHGSWEID